MQERTQATEAKAPIGLYVHWPFCKSKCPYCDFNSHVREGVEQARWQKALLAELDYWGERSQGRPLSSVFFGGGTPSLMASDTAAAIIDRLPHWWDVAAEVEITLEANPTSVEADKLAEFRRAGVNRASMGIQALSDADLRFLGREHSAREALRAFEVAHQLFARTSFDLIYARPGQSLNAWEAELTEALTYAGSHLSLYQLTIEPNTAFHTAYHKQQAFTLPDDELAADMYQLTQSIMEGAGLPAYEISNHAAPGQECRHNLIYWQGQDYLGIGPGAHGRIVTPILQNGVLRSGAKLPGAAQTAHLNGAIPRSARPEEHQKPIRHSTLTHKTPERWIQQVERLGHGLEEVSPIDSETWFEECVMTGLRLRNGIDLSRLELQLPGRANLLLEKAQPLMEEGLLEASANQLRTSSKGRLLLNPIIGHLLG